MDDSNPCRKVVVAYIEDNGFILAGVRPEGAFKGKWELVGGGVEASELPEIALKREVFEELGCACCVQEELAHVVHAYSTGCVDLTVFAVELLEKPVEGKFYKNLQWISLCDLRKFEWLEGTIKIFEQLGVW